MMEKNIISSDQIGGEAGGRQIQNESFSSKKPIGLALLNRMDCYVKLNKIDEIAPNTITKFSCKECGLSYKYKKTLKLHIRRMHHIDAKSKIFENKENAMQYSDNLEYDKVNPNGESINILTDGPVIPSSSTDGELNTRKNKNRLMSDIHNYKVFKDRFFKCSICHQLINGELAFEKHYQSNHSYLKSIPKCSQCLEEFATKEQLFWHCRMIHFQLQLYECDICKLTSVGLKQLLKHKKLCQSTRTTEVIGISDSSDKTSKLMFESTLSQDCRFSCWVCDATFDSDDDLIIHFDSQHFQKP